MTLRPTRRSFVATLVALGFTTRLSAAEYFKQTTWFAKQEGSDKPKELEGSLKLDRDAKSVAFFADNINQLELPFSSISNLVYERAKRPRYGVGLLLAWPLLFTKTKKHFLTIQYKDTAGAGQYALFQLDKKNYREVLAAVESATSIKLERLEEQ